MEKKIPTSKDNPYSLIAVAKALRRVVKRHPIELYTDPLRLLEVLKNDLHSDYPQETSLIIVPLKINIIEMLSSVKDKKKLEQKLLPAIDRITSQYGYGNDEARWAAYSWAYALDKITENDYEKILKIDLFPERILSPLEKEIHTARPHGSPGKPSGVRFDKEVRSPREYHKLVSLSSTFRNNKTRVPIAVAVIAITIFVLTTISRDIQQNSMQTYSIQTKPTTFWAGNNATMTASPSLNSDGSIPEYKWLYKVINGSESKSKGLGNGLNTGFQTPLSEKKYSLQVELQAKDEKGSYNKVAEKTIMVEPVNIQIVLE